MKLARITIAFMLVALAVTSVAAQSGSLSVRVLDSSDKTPLPGATVVLSNSMQLVAETAVVTNAEGVVDFPVLRPGGGYIVQVTFPGYAPVRQGDIRVKINDSQELVVQLGEEITEYEKVVARREVVDLEETQTSTSFGDEFIQDLPVQGRFYTNVLTLAPGVQDQDGDGNPNVHGARERDFQTVVGGVANVDPLTGLALTNINIDSIEEVEVITAGAGVEYGRAQGGYANVIEKQGSNEFEGLFNFIFRSSVLDGNGATNLTGNRLPEFEWIQPAIQVSGPIIRDKLWYRLSHEYLKVEEPVDTLTAVEVETTTRTTNSDMVTWQVSRRNKLAFSFLYDPLKIENRGVSSLTPPESTWTFEFEGPTYRMNWTAPYSPKLLVDSTVAFQDAEINIFPTQTGIPNSCVTGLDLLTQAQCFDVTTGRRSGSYFLNYFDKRQRLTVRSQADIYGGRFLGMSHQFKLGFVIQNERYFRNQIRNPDITFFLLTQSGDSGSGTGGTVEQIGFVSGRFAIPAESQARAVGTNWGFYAQDQVKPFSNLTVTVGARVDREIINSNGFDPFDPGAEAAAYQDIAFPAYLDGDGATIAEAYNTTFTAYEAIEDFVNQMAQALDISQQEAAARLVPVAELSQGWSHRRRLGNIDITNTNVSPFLSVSWDPFKKNKTKFAISAGRHYDKIFLAVPLVELEPITTDLSFFAQQDGAEWRVDGICSGQGACLQPAANVSLVDRDLRTPYQDEITFSYEQELAAETALKITLIRRYFEDQLQDVDLNHLPGDYGRCVAQNAPGDPTILPVLDGTGVGPYGIGDGIMDDCVGEFYFPDDAGGGGGGGAGSGQPADVRAALQRPDGFLDTYLQNPGWGEVFEVGNYNKADYKGVVLEIVRRQYKNWQMNGSYTWSEAVGDAEDWRQILGDDRTTLEDEFGYLSYDQRHVVKVNATTIVPWAGGFRFGAAFQWQSGYPYSLLSRRLRVDSVIPLIFAGAASPEPRVRLRYITGQRNDQRNESWWNFDVHLAKEMNLKRGMNLQLTADIFNLMNENHLRVFGQTNGFNASVRNFGRRFQVGVRLAF
jgi:outer membrane receptor protein involved in Fe transport